MRIYVRMREASCAIPLCTFMSLRLIASLKSRVRMFAMTPGTKWEKGSEKLYALQIPAANCANVMLRPSRGKIPIYRRRIGSLNSNHSQESRRRKDSCKQGIRTVISQCVQCWTRRSTVGVFRWYILWPLSSKPRVTWQDDFPQLALGCEKVK